MCASAGKGGSSRGNSNGSTGVPMARIRSAVDSCPFRAGAETTLRSPAYSGCFEGNGSSGENDAWTRAPTVSARRISSPCPPAIATPSPQMMSGDRAPASIEAIRRITSGAGRSRRSAAAEATIGSSHSSSITFVGTARNTGPRGGSRASLNARLSRIGISLASCASTADFVSGCASRTRSPARIGSCELPRCGC